MSKTQNTSGGIGLGTTLFLIFLILKLTNTVDWSWWWITSPIWLPIAFGMFILILIGIIRGASN